MQAAPAADPKAVLLDAGGVLLDLDYAYLRRLLDAKRFEVDVAALARAEAEARREVEAAIRGGNVPVDPWREYFHVLLGRVGVPGETHDAIIGSLWEAHHRVGLWTVAIEGSLAAVRGLARAGYRVAVISNAEGQVERDLDNAGYDGCFETVVDSHVVGVAKPDPEIFRIALERLELRADEAIYVGDLPAVDVAGARAAGISPVLVDPHDVHADVDVPRIARLAELPELLAQKRTA